MNRKGGVFAEIFLVTDFNISIQMTEKIKVVFCHAQGHRFTMLVYDEAIFSFFRHLENEKNYKITCTRKALFTHFQIILYHVCKYHLAI